MSHILFNTDNDDNFAIVYTCVGGMYNIHVYAYVNMYCVYVYMCVYM